MRAAQGGVFAQIIGTMACVSEADWALCCGVVVNRLRGDAKYFEPGPAMLRERVGKPIFVVPWLCVVRRRRVASASSSSAASRAA